jgi:hypothetical protein
MLLMQRRQPGDGGPLKRIAAWRPARSKDSRARRPFSAYQSIRISLRLTVRLMTAWISAEARFCAGLSRLGFWP